MNWSFLRHAIGNMHGDEEFQEVVVRRSNGAVIEIGSLEKTEDGRWVLVETQSTKR